jgi:DNA-directed RNA polymerase subunit alpha
MATASAGRDLHDVLAEPLDRGNYDKLVAAIYQDYSSVDHTDDRIKELTSQLESASDDEERDLHEKLGILHLARGNYEQAAEHLSAVRTRKTAAHFLGRACLKMRREREALEHLANGRSGEDDVGTDVLMVEAHCELREPDEAETILKAYARADESAGLLYARGRLAECNGDYAEAMEAYEAALELEPEHAGALFRLALNCDLNGEDERAMELYRRCAELNPTFTGALMNLGVLYEDNGRYYEAIDCYKHVLAIDPRHKRAQLYLKDAESSLTMYVDMARTRRMRQLEEIFSLPVENFELSSRSRSALERRDVRTLGGLTKLTRDELLNERNFGDTSLEEIEQLLARYDLGLGEGEGLEAAARLDPALREKLQRSVETLDLSTRCRKCMERLGVTTLGQLIRHTEKELLAVPNFGNTSLNELKTKLAAVGLALKSE